MCNLHLSASSGDLSRCETRRLNELLGVGLLLTGVTKTQSERNTSLDGLVERLCIDLPDSGFVVGFCIFFTLPNWRKIEHQIMKGVCIHQRAERMPFMQERRCSDRPESSRESIGFNSIL